MSELTKWMIEDSVRGFVFGFIISRLMYKCNPKPKPDPAAKSREIADWFLPPNPNVTEDPNSLLRAEIAAALEAEYMRGRADAQKNVKRLIDTATEAGRKAGREEAAEIASDNGTNCCECAERIRARMEGK